MSVPVWPTVTRLRPMLLCTFIHIACLVYSTAAGTGDASVQPRRALQGGPELNGDTCTEDNPCERCEGDCDDDDECLPGLVCYFRTDLTPVPGCSGSGVFDRDYCIGSSDSGDGGAELNGGICATDNPCEKCEGHCVNDDQCLPGLVCFKRDGFDPVPGCSGEGVSDRDYCVKENEIPPTLRPTKSPSEQPTPQPTQRKTRRPTPQPTRLPTKRPTPQPTDPEIVETKEPTPEPTRRPRTPRPTRRPTRPPATPQPTPGPTPRPTRRPTRPPATPQPTPGPTPNPTRRPTRPPATPQPTPRPTPRPTDPQFVETDEPTRQPAPPPTPRPTRRPTRPPTTKQPTPMPTKPPTRRPTLRPTARPTRNPTSRPTMTPTLVATSEVATKLPTVEPTTPPTAEQTPQPTEGPISALAPTQGPTITSITQPTVSPTLKRTPEPSLDPTHGPTTSPTRQPTTSPTSEGTQEPTLDSNLVASVGPSIAPTLTPIQTEIPTSPPQPASLYQIVNLLDIPERKWSLPLHKQTGPGNAAAFSPDGESVYVTLADGTLQVLDARRGAKQWEYTPGQGEKGWSVTCRSGVAFGVEDDVGALAVYAVIDEAPEDSGSEPESRIIAVSYPDNAVLWTSSPLPGEAAGTPVVSKSVATSGTFVFLTHNVGKVVSPEGYFTALRAEDGRLMFTEAAGSKVVADRYPYSPLGISHFPSFGKYPGGETNRNGLVVWTTSDNDGKGKKGYVQAFQFPDSFDSTNRATLGTIRLRNVTWNAVVRPTLSEDGLKLFIAGRRSQVRGWLDDQEFTNHDSWQLQLQLDENRNSQPIRNPGTLSADEKRLFIPSATTSFAAIDVDSGNVLWEVNSTSTFAGAAKVSPDNQRVYAIQSADGKIVARDQTSGEEIWAISCDAYEEDCANSVEADFDLGENGLDLVYVDVVGRVTALAVGESPSPTVAPTVQSSASATPMSSSSSSGDAPNTGMPTIGLFPTSPSSKPSSSPTTTETAEPTAPGEPDAVIGDPSGSSGQWWRLALATPLFLTLMTLVL